MTEKNLARNATSVGALAVSPEQIAESVRNALRNSLYPGATDASIDMVQAYCQAGGLDPMTKPVHIVPMSVKDSASGKYVQRDVIMPGIELYRIKAHRSGRYAGMDPAVFGPTQSSDFGQKGGREINFPEWCEITVHRTAILSNGEVATYSYPSRVYWLETYATQSRDSDVPNAMWRKRPFGQIEKCAEAMALRKGFPEFVGAQPTAEEMIGKTIDVEHETVATAEPIRQPKPKAVAQDKPAPSTGGGKPAGGKRSDRAGSSRRPAEAKGAESTAKPAGATGAQASAAGDPNPAGTQDDDGESPGVYVTGDEKSGARKMLNHWIEAARTSEAKVLERFPRIDMANINDVLADLRQLAASEQEE